MKLFAQTYNETYILKQMNNKLDGNSGKFLIGVYIPFDYQNESFLRMNLL